MSILVSEGECVRSTWSTEPDMREALSAKEPCSGDILTHLFAHGIVGHRDARDRHDAIRISDGTNHEDFDRQIIGLNFSLKYLLLLTKTFII